ncbi:MAG: hypothetical protein AB4050_00475 [Synechococcus sp.]
MNSQLNFLGRPWCMKVNDVVETDREATFLGRKANVQSPVKAPPTKPNSWVVRSIQACLTASPVLASVLSTGNWLCD